MSIKRFLAKTTRDALQLVREALGPDGVILSNRVVDGGVEILALGSNDISALVSPPAKDEEAAAAASPRREEHPAGLEIKASDINVPANPATDKSSPAPDTEVGTGFKNLSRLQFPVFDGERGQLAKHWTVADLAIESHQTENPVVYKAAAPDAANGDKKRQTAAGSRKTEHAIIKRIADQVASTPAESSKAPVAAAPAGRGAKRTAASSRKVVKAPANKQKPMSSGRELADEVAASVLREIRSMRGNLEQQLATLTWSEQQRRDPIRGRVLRQLLAAGFSAPLSHDLLDKLPLEYEGRQEEMEDREEAAMDWVKTVLAGNIQSIGNENEMLEKGGVYALVGPTGVGKTTTTAKLAARCVVRHGADKLALLTTDGYRIGGHEQLRIYGKILGVTVYAVKDTQDLALALAELRGKHMVLIDTVGMGQRDKMVAEQVAMLAGCGTEVKRLLLLNAASSGDTLSEVVQAYRGDGLAGAIITKLDEAAATGSVLDIAIRHQLQLYYVATGQRVPEDLHLANPGSLVNEAFNNIPAASPFAMPEEAFPLFMAGFKNGAAKLEMSGARLG